MKPRGFFAAVNRLLCAMGRAVHNLLRAAPAAAGLLPGLGVALAAAGPQPGGAAPKRTGAPAVRQRAHLPLAGWAFVGVQPTLLLCLGVLHLVRLALCALGGGLARGPVRAPDPTRGKAPPGRQPATFHCRAHLLL